MPIVNRIADLTAEIAEWRHDLHAHPELLYDVQRTAGVVAEKLKSFGCDEVVPGTKQLADVKDAVDAALAQELLTKISGLQRERTEVKYTAAWPHFKPGTQELAK